MPLESDGSGGRCWLVLCPTIERFNPVLGAPLRRMGGGRDEDAERRARMSDLHPLVVVVLESLTESREAPEAFQRE